MWGQLRIWLNNLPIADPLRREQAATLQAFFLIMIPATLMGIPIALAASAEIDRVVGIISSVIQIVLLILAVVVLRQGRFLVALIMLIINALIFAAINMIPAGLEGSRAIFTILAIPVVLAGLLGGRRMLIIALVLSIALVALVAGLSVVAPTLVGYSQETYDPILTMIVFVFSITLLGILIDRFGRAFLLALERAQQREQDLEALHLSLERQVQERTASLQATVQELQSSRTTIGKLGAPILPVLPGVLVVPLIGSFDDTRIVFLTEKVLSVIVDQRARHVIFDMTGVEFEDIQIGVTLMHLADAVRLLGAEPLVVGISPTMAAFLVQQEVALSTRRVYATLQDAVASLQRNVMD